MAWVIESNMHERVVLDYGDREAQVARDLKIAEEFLETLPNFPFGHDKHVMFGDLTCGLIQPLITPPFYGTIERFEAPLLGMFRALPSFAVSQTAIDLIESVDPGVHRYHSFDLTMADGSPTPEPYKLLNIGQRADTIALEDSPNMVTYLPGLQDDGSNKYPQLYRYRRDGGTYSTVSIYKDRISDLSIWFDYKFDQIMICDELVSLFLEHGILRLEKESPYFLWQLREV
ncbi:MAG: DUF1629 domain-containing protein [Erythrobacter sp.]